MEKRYISDPNKAHRRNAFKFNKLFLALLALLLVGGKTTLAQTYFTPQYATLPETEKVYYLVTDETDTNTEYKRFYVYFNGCTSSDIGPFTYLQGQTYNNATSGQSPKMRLVFCTTAPVKLGGSNKIFELKNTTGESSLTLELGENIDLNEKVTPGAGVTLPTAPVSYDSDVTIKIRNCVVGSNSGLFRLSASTTSGVIVPLNRMKLVVKGLTPDPAYNDTTADSFAPERRRQFVFDGGASVGVTPSGDSYKSNLDYGTSGNNTNSPIFRIQGGKMELENVTCQNYWSSLNGSATGLIHISQNNTNNANQAALSLTMTHCQAKNIAAGGYSALFLQFSNNNPNSNASAILTQCRFENCVT